MLTNLMKGQLGSGESSGGILAQRRFVNLTMETADGDNHDIDRSPVNKQEELRRTASDIAKFCVISPPKE